MTKIKYYKNRFKEGIATYLALMIMFVLTAIGLGISLIVVSQMQMIGEMSHSIKAFYAADTGIEHSLYNKRQVDGGTGEVESTSGILYKVVYKETGGSRWKSVGTYEDIKRAIKIWHPAVFDFLLTTTCGISSTSTPCSGIYGMPGCDPDFPDDVLITAALISGGSRTVDFSTNGVYNPVSGCYAHSKDGFEFEACFSTPSCALNCSSTLTFSDFSDIPPLGENTTTTITIYGDAGILTKEVSIPVWLWSANLCIY